MNSCQTEKNYKIIPAECIIRRFRERFVIIGTMSIHLHGFCDFPQDMDIWLDPSLSFEEWDKEVNEVTFGIEQLWTRGNTDSQSQSVLSSTRIKSKPILDIIYGSYYLQPFYFEEVYERSLDCNLGKVADLQTIIRMKHNVGRENDFMIIERIAAIIESCRKTEN
jgi:hypothetical protein